MRTQARSAAAALALAAAAASAEPLTSWNGLELSAGSTGADWAAAVTAAGFDVHLEDFEDEAVGFGDQTLDFGTGATLATVTGPAGSELAVLSGATATFQTPLSGTNYLYFHTPGRLNGATPSSSTFSYTLTFTESDVAGFSFHFADLEVSDLVITLDDGTVFHIEGRGYYGSSDDSRTGWFGFLQEPGAAGIAGITFTFDAADDGVSFDDFRIARSRPGIAAPLPGPAAIATVGVLACGVRRRRA